MRGSWRPNKDCNILSPPTLLAITAFLSLSFGMLNRGLGAQPLLGHGSHSSIFSPTDLNFLSPGLYNNLMSTYFLRESQFALNSTPRQSRSPPDIFDRMHLLFTLVHFFFWQLGRGQYATHGLILEYFCADWIPLILLKHLDWDLTNNLVQWYLSMTYGGGISQWHMEVPVVCYRHRIWTRRYEFNSWTRLIAFHIALIPLGKVSIQLFSLQLWINSRTD